MGFIPERLLIIIIIIEGLSLLQSIPPTTPFDDDEINKYIPYFEIAITHPLFNEI